MEQESRLASAEMGRPKSLGKNGNGSERHEFIYRAISDAIIKQQLQPGARLREDALTQVFNISRTGIRKILQRLALEQLVTITPRRGASVTRPTAEEARDVFAARKMLEGGLMADVVRQINAESVNELREMTKREHEAFNEGEQSTAIQLSAAFHVRLAQLSGNATLAAFVEQLCSRSSLILAVYGSAEHLGCGTYDHDGLISYLAEGNEEKAQAFMLHHLTEIESSLSFVEEEALAPDLHKVFGLTS